MMRTIYPLGVLFGMLAAVVSAQAENWNQGGGPNGNWKTDGENPPTSWSASTGDQVLWRTTLPESGQGSVIVWGDRAFVTANTAWEGEENSQATGSDIDGYCLDSATGEILWKVRLPGTRTRKYAGPFSDSTMPSPVTDGRFVWFFNCSGMIGCYDFDGKEVWSYSWTPRGLMANRQFEPMLLGDVILNVEVLDKSTVVDTGSLNDNPAIKGLKNGFDQEHFTFIHAYDKLTGELKWVSEDPTSVHSASCLGLTEDGEPALLHSRGGGHHPIETPQGLSLTSLAPGSEGKTLWQYRLKTGSSYTQQWNSKYASWWGKGGHLVLDAVTGELISEQPLAQNVRLREFDEATGSYRDAKMRGTKGTTHYSNLLVGDYHYFRSYKPAFIGRIHLGTGAAQYLQVPIQVVRKAGQEEQLRWQPSEAPKNDTTNSRGIDVGLADKRGKGNGWGHVSSAPPILVGDILYIPTMIGTTYVIDTSAETLDENALLSVSDSGPAGETLEPLLAQLCEWQALSSHDERGPLYWFELRWESGSANNFLSRFSILPPFTFILMTKINAIEAACCALALGISTAGLSPAAEPLDFDRDVRPILVEKCFSCHGSEKQKGDIRLDQLSTDFIGDPRAVETWHDVLDVVSIGEMPPDDEPDLSAKDRILLTDWIRGEVDAVIAATKGLGGGVVLRRLNGVEYRYTLTDLLGVEANYGAKLPADPLSSEGFLNDGAALGLSAMQLDSYLEGAREALAAVLVEGGQPQRISVIKEKPDDKNRIRPGKPSNRLGRSGYFVVHIDDDEMPDSGEFVVRVSARAERVEGKPAPMLHAEYGFSNGPFSVLESVGVDSVVSAESKVFEFRGRAEDFPLLSVKEGGEPKKGKVLGQVLVLTNAYDDGERGSKEKGKKKKGKEVEARESPAAPTFPEIVVESVEFIARDYETWPPAAHRRILFESDKSGQEYAAEVFCRFMRRAWRRPPTVREVATYVDQYKTMTAGGGSELEALRKVLSVVLASPNFLFLVEPQPEDEASRPLNAHELAARLSYFLWSSMPDEQLSVLADSGELSDQGTLSAQVRRLIDDEKSSRFVEQFTTQWLDLGGVDRVAVNPEFYPDFDEALKPEMVRECQQFFGEILRSDTSALQFLDADFTMANADLARHYGLEGPLTHRFERVSLEGSRRPGGLLGHAAVHLINSDGGESHPIKRAVWIRERLLHDPPKPPPPNVPSLAEVDPDFAKLSIREQMELHRSDPACNDCHRGIDPWGLALERYDAIGQWRDEILRPTNKRDKFDTFPVVSETTLPDGHEISGLDDLKAYLLAERRDQFSRALVSKLLTYALGRTLGLGDKPAVDELAQRFAEDGYRLAPLVNRIVHSELFLTK